MRFLLLCLCAVLFVGSAQAQKAPRYLGVQLGEPTGVVFRPSPALEFLGAWDLDDFLFLNVHRLIESRPQSVRPLRFVYGPGLFVGVYDRPEDEFGAGVSARAGLEFVGPAFRIFATLSPRFGLVPETEFDLGGGIGGLIAF